MKMQKKKTLPTEFQRAFYTNKITSAQQLLVLSTKHHLSSTSVQRFWTRNTRKTRHEPNIKFCKSLPTFPDMCQPTSTVTWSETTDVWYTGAQRRLHLSLLHRMAD